MKLSHIHRQDLLSLSRVFNQQDITIRLAERYGYKIGYEYIDRFISDNKPPRQIIKSKAYKLLTRIINLLKQVT